MAFSLSPVWIYFSAIRIHFSLSSLFDSILDSKYSGSEWIAERTAIGWNERQAGAVRHRLFTRERHSLDLFVAGGACHSFHRWQQLRHINKHGGVCCRARCQEHPKQNENVMARESVTKLSLSNDTIASFERNRSKSWRTDRVGGKDTKHDFFLRRRLYFWNSLPWPDLLGVDLT